MAIDDIYTETTTAGSVPTRFRLSVPSTLTNLTLGAADASKSFDGFSGQTAGHLFLTAGFVADESDSDDTDENDDSTATLQARSWVLNQSVNNSVYTVASDNILLGAKTGSVIMAGGGGIAIAADYPVDTGEVHPQSLAEPEHPMKETQAFADIEKSGKAFAGLDASVAVMMGVYSALHIPISWGSGWDAVGTFTDMLGIGQNAWLFAEGVQAFGDEPWTSGGLALRAKNHITVHTLRDIGINAIEGIALQATNIAQIGLNTVELWGGIGVEMWSPVKATVSSYHQAEVTAINDIDVGARTGKLWLMGRKVRIGYSNPDADTLAWYKGKTAQAPAQSVHVDSLTHSQVRSRGAAELLALGGLADGWYVQASQTGATIGMALKAVGAEFPRLLDLTKPHMVVSPNGVEAVANGGKTRVKISETGAIIIECTGDAAIRANGNIKVTTLKNAEVKADGDLILTSRRKVSLSGGKGRSVGKLDDSGQKWEGNKIELG